MYVVLVIIFSSKLVVIGSSHCLAFFFFQAEDGIRDLVRSRGLGDVYKRQLENICFLTSTTKAGVLADNFQDRQRIWEQLIAQVLSLIHI